MARSFWHALSPSAVVAELRTNIDLGLSKSEATTRLKKGANRLPDKHKETIITRILRQFASPIAILLVFAVLATVFLQHYTDAIVIAIALLVNVVMGVLQEGRASQAFEALKKGEAHHAVVIRGGESLKISAEELVPGDVVALMAGDAVPADVRLFEAHNLMVNEAALSGEWLPVEKILGTIAENAPLVERTTMAFAGTLIVSGAGKGIVVETGPNTEIGAIAEELQKSHKVETPLMKDVKEMARFLVFAVLIIVAWISTRAAA
jgi:magnesium-transporting ATPase (P-type)